MRILWASRTLTQCGSVMFYNSPPKRKTNKTNKGLGVPVGFPSKSKPKDTFADSPICHAEPRRATPSHAEPRRLEDVYSSYQKRFRLAETSGLSLGNRFGFCSFFSFFFGGGGVEGRGGSHLNLESNRSFFVGGGGSHPPRCAISQQGNIFFRTKTCHEETRRLQRRSKLAVTTPKSFLGLAGLRKDLKINHQTGGNPKVEEKWRSFFFLFFGGEPQSGREPSHCRSGGTSFFLGGETQKVKKWGEEPK